MIVLLIIGCLVYYFKTRPQVSSRATNLHTAMSARPASKSSYAPDVDILYKNQSVFDSEFTCHCDEPVSFTVKSLPPQRWGDDEFELRALIVVPRMLDGPEDDFIYLDPQVDRFFGLNPRTQNSDFSVLYSNDLNFQLRPGRYRLRYYLQRLFTDMEQEKFPIIEYLGSGTVELTAPLTNDTACQTLPLEIRHEYFKSTVD